MKIYSNYAFVLDKLHVVNQSQIKIVQNGL